ncbi:hypothetical protein GJ744_007214 [Endocarpon pusillum]|uniref:Uncharacterized protein n=1 Tax=Endocarpon pusillum TaxID=364733 RepID=A0A8H7A682_9EURO|nr:hypothetical protein GJ744_007214 [Endocarpon pusillum]
MASQGTGQTNRDRGVMLQDTRTSRFVEEAPILSREELAPQGIKASTESKQLLPTTKRQPAPEEPAMDSEKETRPVDEKGQSRQEELLVEVESSVEEETNAGETDIPMDSDVEEEPEGTSHVPSAPVRPAPKNTRRPAGTMRASPQGSSHGRLGKRLSKACWVQEAVRNLLCTRTRILA